MPKEPKGALNIRNCSKDLIRRCKKAAIDSETDLRGFVIKVLTEATNHIELPKKGKNKLRSDHESKAKGSR